MTSKERAELRALGNKEETIFQIGKGGITDNLINQLSDALDARELIKIRCLETSPVSAKEACFEVCEKLGAEGIQVVGSRFLIYRKSKKKAQNKK